MPTADLEKLIALEAKMERLRAELDEHQLQVEPMLAELEKKRNLIAEKTKQMKRLQLSLARQWQMNAIEIGPAKVPAQILTVMTAQPDSVWTVHTLKEAGVIASSKAVISAALSRLKRDEKIERITWGQYRAIT